MTLSIPFPSRVSEHIEHIREANKAWCWQRGLVQSAEGETEYLSWGLAEAIARIYVGERDLLTQCLHFFAIGFLFDDQFDPAVPDRERVVSQVASEMALIPSRPDEAPLDVQCPLTVAWREVWQQMAGRMSPVWQARFAANFAQWMTAHVWETRLSNARTVLDVEDYIRLRRRSLGLMHSMDIQEWTAGFEVPAAAIAHPLFRQLRLSTTDAVAFMNDVHSVERESARHDTHNLVLCLQRHRGMSREDAVAHTTAITQSTVDKFGELRQQVPGMCDELRLAAADVLAVDRAVGGMQDWIRGNYDWATHSGRYSPAAEYAPPYVDDLLRPQPCQAP